MPRLTLPGPVTVTEPSLAPVPTPVRGTLADPAFVSTPRVVIFEPGESGSNTTSTVQDSPGWSESVPSLLHVPPTKSKSSTSSSVRKIPPALIVRGASPVEVTVKVVGSVGPAETGCCPKFLAPGETVPAGSSPIVD